MNSNNVFSFIFFPLQIDSLIDIKDGIRDSNIPVAWMKLSVLRAVLRPLAALTRVLQGEQFTAGDLRENIEWCKHQLEKVKLNDEDPNAVLAADHMLKALNDRCEMIYNKIQFQAALYLDPRFVNRGGGMDLSHEQKQAAVVCIFFSLIPHNVNCIIILGIVTNFLFFFLFYSYT